MKTREGFLLSPRLLNDIGNSGQHASSKVTDIGSKVKGGVLLVKAVGNIISQHCSSVGESNKIENREVICTHGRKENHEKHLNAQENT